MTGNDKKHVPFTVGERVVLAVIATIQVLVIVALVWITLGRLN